MTEKLVAHHQQYHQQHHHCSMHRILPPTYPKHTALPERDADELRVDCDDDADGDLAM